MSTNSERILETLGKIIPELTLLQKEKFLSYGEGYADGVRSSRIKVESEENVVRTS